MTSKILGVAMALWLSAPGVVGGETIPLPTVVIPNDIIPPEDVGGCERLLVEQSRNKVSCGASGGTGNIAFRDASGEERRCSFVFVNDGRPLAEKARLPSVLTAAHCLRHGMDTDSVRLNLINHGFIPSAEWSDAVARSPGYELGAELLVRDSASDMALLRVKNILDREEICLNPLSRWSPSAGASVHGYGSEVGPSNMDAFEGTVDQAGRFRFSSGRTVHGYQVLLDRGRLIGGMSGGGLFDSAKRLIGVVSAVDADNCKRTFFGGLTEFSGFSYLDDPDLNVSDPTRVVEASEMPSVRVLRIEPGGPSNKYAKLDQSAAYDSFGPTKSVLHRVEALGRAGLHVVLGSCSTALSHAIYDPDKVDRTYCSDSHFEDHKDLLVNLRGEDGEYLASSRKGPDDTQYLAEVLEPGTYYVRVKSRYQHRNVGMYGLAASMGDAHRTDSIPIFLSPEESRMGFIRVVNNEDKIAYVDLTRLEGVRTLDEQPMSDPITVLLKPKEARHFNALDLQDGNSD